MKNLFLVSFLLISSLAFTQSQANFPTDKRIDELKIFWVNIFTKYNDEQTLIHDEVNTDVVYSIVEHKGAEHFQRKKKVDVEIKNIRHKLSLIYKKNFKNLNLEEEKVLSFIPEELRNRKSLLGLTKSIRAQQGMSNRFKDGLVRSDRFLKQIKEILEKYQVPEELAYLPHVESSFNYFATSKVGAAGIWQLMPRTAKAYNLKINDATDERLDPLKASEVAIKLLRDNYRLVKSWPLAITAYNHGTKNIKKTIKELKSYDPILVLDSINKRSFQFASRNFYPSYLAAVEVAKNKRLYFPELREVITNDIEEMILAKRMDIKVIIKKLDLSLEEVKLFNPQITGVSWKKNFSLPQGFVIKYPKIRTSKESNILFATEKNTLLSYIEVKAWFDRLCGITPSSIASNLK